MKTIISPHMGMPANFGRKPGQPSKTHCIGASVEGVCAERSACVLHRAQLKAPTERPMLLPRVGTNPCHYRKGTK